jgi:hypothetical protein
MQPKPFLNTLNFEKEGEYRPINGAKREEIFSEDNAVTPT